MIDPKYWMETLGGYKFRLGDLPSNTYDIHDIASALSKICRFGGHCTHFYSVAQHCVQGSWKAPDDLKLAFLMHDATEAYIGDIVRPIKRSLSIDAIEDELHKHICAHFDIEYPFPEIIHEIDNRMLMTEASILKPGAKLWEWEIKEEPYFDMEIVPWTPEVAYDAFMEYYNEYRRK